MRLRCVLACVFAVALHAYAQEPPPPAPPASALLAQAQSPMLQRIPGAPPFHIRLELAQVDASGHTKETGWYEETWRDSRNWRREAQLGNKHVAQQDVDGERDVILTEPLDAQGVRISALAQWALPAYDADPDSGVMQHIVSHAPDGRAVPMLRVGTRSVTQEQPFKSDALAWFLAEGEPKLLGLMDGDFFVEYFDREMFQGKSVAKHWQVSTEAHLFLKATVQRIDSPAK